MEINTVETLKELKNLYDHSAMTWEGLVSADFEIAMRECGAEGVQGYLIKGEIMNRLCKLTRSNAYPKDLNIFAIYPFKGLAIYVGARWMDDIIDNNARRQEYHPFDDAFEEEKEY